MKIVCKVCRHEIEIDESQFSPGDRVEVECHRCGWFDEIEIPAREPAESKPSVRLVSPAEPQAEPLPEVPSPEPVPQVRSVPDPIRRRRKPAKPEVSEVSEPVSTPVTSSSEVRPVRETGDETPVRKPERRRTVPQPPTPVPAPVTPEKPRRNQRQQNTPSRARGKGVRFGDILVVLVLASLIFGGGRAYSFLADCYHRVFGSSEKVEAVKIVAADETAEEIPLEERMAVEEEHLAYDDLAPADSVAIPPDEVITGDDLDAPLDDLRMGFSVGPNYLLGDMIHTDGRRFPFSLRFDYSAVDDEISNVRYENLTSGTKLRLKVTDMTLSSITLEGTDGGKKFILQFIDRRPDPYTGDAWWGDFHQKIELHREYD